jgi:uncharacterized membrane protein YqjE
MNAWLQQLISRSILIPLQQKGARLLRKAALFALAAFAVLFAIVFLSVAFFIWIIQLVGVLAACLAFGAICLTIGVIALLFAVYSGREKLRTETSSRSQQQQNTGAAKESLADEQNDRAQDDRAEAISEAVVPVIEILRSLGWKREEWALLAGAELAKTLPPLTLVGFAIICGFLIGRMIELPRDLLKRKKAA